MLRRESSRRPLALTLPALPEPPLQRPLLTVWCAPYPADSVVFEKMIAPFLFLLNDALWCSTGKETNFDFYDGCTDQPGCIRKRVASTSG